MADVKKRVPTGQLVTIGQFWRRKSRRRADRYTVQITQVHRGQDREVEAVVVAKWFDTPLKEGAKVRIKFADLREKYMLIEQ